MRLDFGIGYGPDVTIGAVADQVRCAESLGFGHVTVADVGMVAPETIAMMTVVATSTDRIRVGHGVTDPLTYHPTVIANAAATIRELAGDRAFVGLGTGGPYGKPLKRPATLRQLRAALAFVRAYTAGEEAELDGERWRSRWIPRSPWAGRPVPLMVAVCGPRMCELAGELGDGMFSKGVDPMLQRWRRDLAEHAAARAGRNGAPFTVWVRTQCVLADSKERARAVVAPYAARCATELHAVLERGSDAAADLRRRLAEAHPGLLEEIAGVASQVGYETAGPIERRIPQRVIDFFLLTGPPAEIAGRLREMEAAGVDGVTMTLYDPGREEETMRSIHDELMRG
jgi:5,10-methylenetetrahydromethanopterin reductase